MAGGHHGEPASCNTIGSVSFILGLVGGTGSSIIIKLLYQLSAEDSTGTESYFEKPLFLTWLMFMAMAFALPVYGAMQLCRPKELRDSVKSEVLWLLILPSIFDMLGTNFAQIGLVFTTVSYFQLLRCTVIIVTAFLKAFVLKKQLAGYMWWGVGINTAAMVMVGMTGFLQPDDPQPNGASNPALGVVFILLSCIVQGSQYIFEEKVMAVDNAPPLVVIGMEGVWGALIMFALFPIVYYLPGRDKGSAENVLDTFVMIGNSDAIKVMLSLFFVTITVYNIFCIYVTAYLSAIWHAILDNFRPISVWGTDLLIFYVFTNGSFGESWTPLSWLQLAGMAVLFAGTAVYNGSLRLPGLRYDQQYESLGSAKGELASPGLMNSPLLTRVTQEYKGFESPATAPAVARARAEGRLKPPQRPRGGSYERSRLSDSSLGEVEYGHDGAAR